MECGESRKKYDMRSERIELFPKDSLKKPKRKRRKKYYLRKGERVAMHEVICGMCNDPPFFIRAYINDDIHYGVFTTRDYEMNEILLEYKGTLVTRTEAQELHNHYARNGVGCYIVDFVHNEQKMCIDATETDCYGRYVNDAVQRYANCEMKKFVIKDVPHLCLVAKRKIPMLEELRYDYGDTKNMHWRGITRNEKPFKLSDITGGFWGGDGNNNSSKDEECS